VGEVVGVGNRSEDQQARGGSRDVDEELAAQLRALGPHQLRGARDGSRVKLGVPERPVEAAIGAHQDPLAGSWTAHCGDERDPAVISSNRSE
jgi:hypothetical protein